MTDVDRLTENLQAIPAAYQQLALFRTPGSRPADPDKIQTFTSPARPPVDLTVLDLEDRRLKDAEPVRDDYDLDRRAGSRRRGILPTLGCWVRLVDGEMWDEGVKHPEPAEESTVDTECGWLLGVLDWIADRRWVDELLDDTTAMLRDIRRAIGERPAEAYKCPTCQWVVEPQSGGAWYRCSGCSRTWAMHNEISRLLAEQGNTQTLRQCAEQVGRPVKTLHEWRARGWINPVAKNRVGQFLYDVRLVEKVAAEVKRGRRAC